MGREGQEKDRETGEVEKGKERMEKEREVSRASRGWTNRGR